jgi:hypothetical protein
MKWNTLQLKLKREEKIVLDYFYFQFRNDVFLNT